MGEFIFTIFYGGSLIVVSIFAKRLLNKMVRKEEIIIRFDEKDEVVK